MESPGAFDRRERAIRWLRVLAVAAFLLHATTYLYFFVDDEGIPFAHAQSLLDGRGFTYPAPEGRVEGASDPLHVGLSALILAAVRLAGLPLVSVFFVGKAISLACGAAVVWLVPSIMKRLGVTSPAAVAAGLAVTALAGPLAVWSCSSLEAVPFALGVAFLVRALSGESPAGAEAAAATLFLVLERSDGWVWAGAIGVAYFVLGREAHRRAALRSVLVPGLLAAACVQVFRVLYFHEWAPMPVYAKVLFKLGHGRLVTKVPEPGYAASFAATYHVVPLLAALVVAVRGLSRPTRPIALAVALLALYVSIVGDWMFGFRFFVPLIAPAAVLLATGLARWRRPLLWAGTLAALVWSAVVARGFEHVYLHQPLEEPRRSFWIQPSVEVGRYFGPYYGLVQLLSPVAPPGTLIAYSQAGLVPFLLHADNIDTLGPCSRFYARLPATDVAYTEVGRYEPSTPAPVISARRAYLINRAPRFLIERTDLLKRVNGDRIPPSLFGGYFTLFAVDSGGRNAVYRWAGLSNEAYRRDATLFLENLAHVSNIDRATVDERPLRGRDLLRSLGFLAEHRGTVEANPDWVLSLQLEPRHGAVARQLYAERVQSNGAAELAFTLRDREGRVTAQHRQPLPPGISALDHWFPSAVPVATVELRIRAREPRPVRVRLWDVRVMGQDDALAGFVRAQVPFDASPARGR